MPSLVDERCRPQPVRAGPGRGRTRADPRPGRPCRAPRPYDDLAAALDAGAGELVPLARSETHLPDSRLSGELRRTSFQARLLASRLREGLLADVRVDHADSDWPMGPRPNLRRTTVPLGPVLVFAAGNFPFAFGVAGGDTVSALAAGCPVRAVAFTGSQRAGRHLFDLACARETPIPFYGELGSTNPVVVTPDAWRERAGEIARGLTASFTLGSGQFCTKPGVVLVPDAAALAAALPPLTSGRMLTPETAGRFHTSLAEPAAEPGVEISLCGDEADDAGTAPVVLCATAAALARPDAALPAALARPDAALPAELRDDAGGPRLVDGRRTG